MSRDGSAAKKAEINAIWEQLNAKDAVLSARASPGGAAPSVAAVTSRTAAAVPSWMRNLGMVPKKVSTDEVLFPRDGNGAKEAPATVNSQGWMRNLGMVPKRTSSDELKVLTEAFVIKEASQADGDRQHSEMEEAARKEEARKVAAAALAAAKASVKASIEGKVEINEVRDFAGEEVRVTKYVDPNSKVALEARRKAETATGLDALLEQIGKKQKLNILDKSRKDWGDFKEEKGIEVELEEHNKSGDTYTDKVAFLQRTDFREYERERDARLVLMSKRRSESAPVD